MKRKYVALCIIVILLSLGVANAQETRMVPMYRCLWIGPEGGTWNNSGGDPNAVWETYELSWTDPEGYLIDWTLIENPVYTWPDIISMAEFKDNAVVFVNEPPPTAIQGLVIRDANLTVNNDLTVVGDGQDDGFMAVCVGQGADGILNINGGILTCGSTEGPLPGQTGPIVNNFGGSRFLVGRAINATDSAVGIVNQYGGTVRIANHLQIADIGYGEARELLGGYAGWGNLPLEQRQAIAATSANSTYNLYDGVIEVTNNIEVGKANGSYGIFNVYGGEVNVGGALRSYYSGEMTINGGTVNVTGDLVWPRRALSHGVLTLKKGTLSFNNAVICEDGTGISEVNVIGGSFDCRGNWQANGSGGTGEAQQTIKIDCGNIENVHFGGLDTTLDTNDLMDLVLVVPKDTEPNNAATKVWIDGDATFNGWTAIRVDVNKDFAGQIGDKWELVSIGGFVTGMDQVLIISDSSKYIFSVELVEREVNFNMRKIITAELIDIIPDPSPVHSYTFEDGTAEDSVGGADGVLMGDAAIVDGSLVVDGDGDWMDVPGDVIAINTYSAMTLELWCTQSVDNPFSMTASFGGTWDNGFGKDYIFIATGRGDQMNRGAIANTPDQDSPWADEVGVSSPELNDGIEHHYVCTITAAELAYYVNGVLIGTAPMGDTTIAGVSNDFVYLGKGIYSVDATMNCSINEFNIYDKALSAGQIAASYDAGPQMGADPGTANLVAYYPLDGDILDASGNGRDGTVFGDPTFVEAVLGMGLEFDGDDYVDTGYTEDLTTWTISAWIKSPAAPAGGSSCGPVHRESNYQINWNHWTASWRGSIGTNVNGEWYSASLGVIEADTWYHLVGTYDGENLKAYKDGILITVNESPSGAPMPETNSLKLARHAESERFFNGTIDEVRIYNKALSAAEIHYIAK